MAELPRLNGVIRALEQDQSAFSTFVGEGYRFLMTALTRSYGALDKGRQLAGRT